MLTIDDIACCADGELGLCAAESLADLLGVFVPCWE
jgi:hypothetical protein